MNEYFWFSVIMLIALDNIEHPFHIPSMYPQEIHCIVLKYGFIKFDIVY